MLPSALHEETETHRIQKKWYANVFMFELVLIRCLSTILLTDNVTGLAVSKDGDYILIGYETKVSHRHGTSIDNIVHYRAGARNMVGQRELR